MQCGLGGAKICVKVVITFFLWFFLLCFPFMALFAGNCAKSWDAKMSKIQSLPMMMMMMMKHAKDYVRILIGEKYRLDHLTRE